MELFATSPLSWSAKAGHPGGALWVEKKKLGGAVKPGHDKFWFEAR
jgi:hypothetical protein